VIVSISTVQSPAVAVMAVAVSAFCGSFTSMTIWLSRNGARLPTRLIYADFSKNGGHSPVGLRPLGCKFYIPGV
jgi:hypothetical protein